MELVVTGPKEGAPRLILAHGAGAGMRSEFMEGVAEGLGVAGIACVRFEFPYMRGRSSGFGGRPDRPEALKACWREAIAEAGAPSGLFIGGKSMGGRIATMIADEMEVRGVVCLGYPFHPVGRPGVLRTAHLGALRTPTLIVQGTDDEMGSRAEVEGYALAPAIEVEWVEGGDHSLGRGRGRAARAEAVARAVDSTTRFIRLH